MLENVNFADGFARRLVERLEQDEMSQNQLAQAIGVSRSTVTGWIRHGKLPDAFTLSNICRVLECSGDWLLGLESQLEKTDVSGAVEWLEYSPVYARDLQREHIEQGMRLFNGLLQDSASSIMTDHNLRYLQFAIQSALRAGAIRLTHVRRDDRLEQAIRDLYPFLKNIVVADVPRQCDATLIRAELVSFLAATEVLSDVIRESVVGLGTGFTLLRMCEHSIPGVDQFKGTNWLPLVTFTDDNESGYTANQLAKLMQLRHPGSRGVYLPHPSLCEKDSKLQADFDEATRLMQSVQTMFITVNGVGRRDRTLKSHPLTDFRTVDYAFDSAYLRDKFAELEDKEAFGGEVLSYLIDTNGETIGWDEKRVWQVDLEVLRYNSDLVGKVVIVAARHYKAQAVETCIKNGLANALVIDNEIGEYLVSQG
ncbi:MAG: helix-turn-helix domain-containing protein [Chloroflexi bacterium]|nr:helix-turn-helix domain-containing protein [Chloroflexota bacterium]